MTYAFSEDLPIDAATHQRIVDALGDETPKGMIVHLAVEKPDGTLRITDVWESKADYDRFNESRLTPAVLKAMGDNPPDGQPVAEELNVVHVWAP